MTKYKEKYKEKIIKDIEEVPEEKTPILYKIIHLLVKELTSTSRVIKKRGSLKGVWKDSQIDESLFTEAKESLFTYEK